MLAYKFMMYGVRKYFELKPEWYKTNLNSFLLAYQQNFDGSGLHYREFPNKQTAPVLDLLRMKPGYQTKCNFTEVWGKWFWPNSKYTHICTHMLLFQTCKHTWPSSRAHHDLGWVSPHSINSAHSYFQHRQGEKLPPGGNPLYRYTPGWKPHQHLGRDTTSAH